MGVIIKMRTLKSLQTEYNANEKNIQTAKKSYDQNKNNILENVIELAKYKAGDTVIVKDIWREIHKKGIIRQIVGIDMYSNKLSVYYIIGKITKSGKIHKTLNDPYSNIAEKDIIEVIK